jgi:hypothetical protein
MEKGSAVKLFNFTVQMQFNIHLSHVVLGQIYKLLYGN